MGWLPDDKWERREVVVTSVAVLLCLALLALGAWINFTFSLFHP